MAFLKFSKGKKIKVMPNGIGEGAFFDGSTYATLNCPNLPIGTNPTSISVWFNQKDGGGLQTICGYGDNETKAQKFIMTNFPYIYSHGWCSDVPYEQKKIVYNKWYHVVFVYENAIEKVYLNGEFLGQRDFEFNTTTSNFEFRIGTQNMDRFFYGNIKDLNVYNRALTQTEVETLYNKGKVEDGLVLNIPLTYGKDDESIFSSKSFVYDYSILTTSSGFDNWGYPIRYDIASECGVAYSAYPVPNDTDTLILYQPKANDTSVANYAKGASRLASQPINYGVTVAEGKLQFNGSSYIEYPANSFPEGVFDTLGEFTVDMWFDNQNISACCLFGTTKGSNGSSRMDWITNINTGGVSIGGFQNLKNGGEPYTKFRLTLEVWNDNGNSVFASYVNGVKQNSGSWTLNSRSYALCLGWDNESGDRYFQGNMAMFSIRSKADYKGIDFEVKENPYA